MPTALLRIARGLIGLSWISRALSLHPFARHLVYHTLLHLSRPLSALLTIRLYFSLSTPSVLKLSLPTPRSPRSRSDHTNRATGIRDGGGNQKTMSGQIMVFSRSSRIRTAANRSAVPSYTGSSISSSFVRSLARRVGDGQCNYR